MFKIGSRKGAMDYNIYISLLVSQILVFSTRWFIQTLKLEVAKTSGKWWGCKTTTTKKKPKQN